MRVVVFGAGAVGSVLGGLLALERHDVLLVCRRDHAQAISDDGLKLRSATGDYVANPRAAETLSRGDIGADTFVLLTAKSHDTEACVEEIAALAPPEVPFFCVQNGVSNEDTASRRFENIYSGICYMTCSTLQPGHASFRKAGRVVLGKHPKGSDAAVRSLGATFESAGLDVCLSRNVMADRWLKLAVNTQSVFHAVIDPRDHDANEFFELKAQILEETRRILKAARIRAKSCEGRDPSIDEMIEDLRRPRARRSARGINVHNSTWQDLYLRRARLESPFFHGPFIEMAGEHGIAAHYNQTALDIAERCHAAAAGPETMRLADVLSEIEKKSTSS